MANNFKNPWDVGGEYYNQNALNTQFLPEGFLETKQSYQELKGGRQNNSNTSKNKLRDNLLILLEDPDVIEEHYKNSSHMGTVEFIIRSNINNAYLKAKKHFGNKKLKNLLINSHGSSMDGYVVTRAAHDSDGYPNNIIHYQKVEKYINNDPSLGKHDKEDIEAIVNLFNMVETNGIVLFHGCNSGGGASGKELLSLLSTLTSNNLTIYGNMDYTTDWVPEKILQIWMGGQGLSHDNLSKGWRKAKNGNVTDVKSNVKTGDIYLDPRQGKILVNEIHKKR